MEQQPDLFSMFDVKVDVVQQEPSSTKGPQRISAQSPKSSRKATSTVTKPVEPLKLSVQTVIRYMGETIRLADYFSEEEITTGLLVDTQLPTVAESADDSEGDNRETTELSLPDHHQNGFRAIEFEDIRKRLEEREYAEKVPGNTHIHYVKDKDLIIADVSAKSKGTSMIFHGNTGVYANAVLAVRNPRPVMFVPAQRGWYMVRENSVLRILHGPVNLPDYLDVSGLEVEEYAPEQFETGARLKLRKIDWAILQRFVSDARYYSDRFGTELHAEVYWNIGTDQYELLVPKQIATRSRVIPARNDFVDENRIKVMEIHSHHVWEARPSAEDDAHERSPILYAIVGKVNDLFPDLSVRTCLNGCHIPLRICDVFESPFDGANHEHLPHSQVQVKGGSPT